ncbi:hypothetical protein SLS58_010997 [Diplodia intermedia]|uniref:Pentatricopeptide repeat domain-containing protein n=1 Tax=Diplodia intermedia TaxID=856260 RepID=A0ABR3T2A9_9PEZI
MQTLWSRTLRATKCTCRCHQCLSYSTAVARRSTTAFRKRLAAIPSSTIFYSAIFACAAVADGHAKQQRREKWNHAIQGAKEELGPGDADKRRPKERGSERTRDGARDKGKAEDKGKAKADWRKRKAANLIGFEGKGAEELAEWLKDAVVDVKDPQAAEDIMREKLEQLRKSGFEEAENREAELEKEDTDWTEIEEEWKDARRYTMMESGRPEWPENTGPLFDPDYFPPQSLYATDARKIEGLESRWTRRKIQTMNLSMARLVLRMVNEARLDRYPMRRKWDNVPECWLPENVLHIAMKKEASKFNYSLRIDEFLQRTKAPRQDKDVPEFKPIFGQYPYYQQDHDGFFHSKCHAMNERIFDSFERCFRGEVTIPSLIGTICEELLVSSAPPNITTYNALLLGFTRLREHNFCSMVIDSIHEVHMRPDEITCAAALSHHVLTNNPHGFTRFIQLMTGMSTTSYALMLARPSIALDHAATLYKLQNRVIRHPRSPSRLVQKVHPTPRVMSTIIAGLLKFHGLERTIDICVTLAADGWGFDTAGLTRFLHACAERRDWSAGLAVWQQLQELRQQQRQRPDGGRPLDRSTYLHMLGLCWRCDRRDVFDQVLAEADRAAGYRAGPLEKDFEKMRRRGLGVFGATEDRRQEWALRADMAAKFEAEARVLETWQQQGAASASASASAAAAAAAAARAARSSDDHPPVVASADTVVANDDGEAVMQKIVDDFAAPVEGEIDWRPPDGSAGKDGGRGGGFMSSEEREDGTECESDYRSLD